MNPLTVQTIVHPNVDIDRRLLREISEGSEVAFARLYVRYHKPLICFLDKIVRSRPDAEDLVQEVFVRLWRQRVTIDPDRNIGALIFIIARRTAVDHYRHAGGERFRAVVSDTEYDAASLDLSAQELLEQNETRLLLDIAIARLPPRQRRIFELYYYHGQTPEQIAGQLGLSYDNVRKQIYNNKRQLRDAIATMMALLVVMRLYSPPPPLIYTK